MVGVAEVGQLPAERLDGGIRGLARRSGLGADDGVLAVRLVPHGNDLDAAVERLYAGLQLRLGLVSEAVAGSDGIFVKHQMLHSPYDLPVISEPAAMRPQAEARIGDEEDFFAIDLVLSVAELFGIVARSMFFRSP